MESSCEEVKGDKGMEEEEKEGGRLITSELVRYYKWDEDMTEKARGLIEQSEKDIKAQVNEVTYQRFVKDAKRNWDLFYKANKTNFYKDRHYIKYEFTEMASKMSSSDQTFTLLDAGCGVGNGFYPLFNEYSGRLRVHCCDFSPRAVDFVKQNE
jgi:hypothetical protein